MLIEHNPAKTRHKARAGVRHILEQIEATLKDRRREIMAFEYSIENDLIEFPGESMMQLTPSADYTIKLRMTVRKLTTRR